MTGLIEIKNLKMQAFHGVLTQERTVGNLYSIDLSLTTDITKATLSDNIADTINYAEVAELIREEMLKPSNLLEHVAGRIIVRLQALWADKILGIDLCIAKLSPPIGMDIESSRVHIII